MSTKFADWNPSTKYDDSTAPGWIPSGTVVQFKADRTTGRIINGNGERSLVSYTPDKRTGMSEARNWFPNADLRVAV